MKKALESCQLLTEEIDKTISKNKKAKNRKLTALEVADWTRIYLQCD